MNEWLQETVKPVDLQAELAAKAHQQQLTKPPGALGELETVAIRLAGLQGRTCPTLDAIHIAVFAADHGIAAEGVSAFPQSVTAQMVANFAQGGAAISVAARALAAELEVINLGTVTDITQLDGVRHEVIAPATRSFLHDSAMTDGLLMQALDVGRSVVDRAIDSGAQLFIGGEMGIGNTTTATALASALLAVDPAQLAGPGTGLNSEGVSHKVEVLRQALGLHQGSIDGPLTALRRLGGFEIVALCGAYLRCAQRGLPVLVDGFICTVAALCAVRMQADVRNWLLYSHQSAEPGHRRVLNALEAHPLLSLGMRLGEGSGAAVAVPLLRMACELHGQMATFAQAGVDNRD